MTIKEKRHRLPKEFYKGEISSVFTLCLKKSIKDITNPEIINTFVGILTRVVIQNGCIVPIYCFMPDHEHLIITGTQNDSDIWKTITSYKQQTGFWMSVNQPTIRWQKDFYDHIIRKHEDLASQVRYILNNPVRKGLVSSWEEYPFKGSIGCKIEDILDGIIK
jgi:REP element-mobilizing transposase RayT